MEPSEVKALLLCADLLLTHRLNNEERSSKQTCCSVETQLQILYRDTTQTEKKQRKWSVSNPRMYETILTCYHKMNTGVTKNKRSLLILLPLLGIQQVCYPLSIDIPPLFIKLFSLLPKNDTNVSQKAKKWTWNHC